MEARCRRRVAPARRNGDPGATFEPEKATTPAPAGGRVFLSPGGPRSRAILFDWIEQARNLAFGLYCHSPHAYCVTSGTQPHLTVGRVFGPEARPPPQRPKQRCPCSRHGRTPTMKRSATRFTAFFAALSVVALLATGASAALRAPQVVFVSGSLQGYLNGVGETINVNTDQDATQTWQTTVSNNSTFTLMIELAGNAASNAVGIYNASLAAPPLYQVFPGAA